MKLEYGFKCDYCGKYVDYDKKRDIKFCAVKKDESTTVDTFKTLNMKTYDLCEKCFIDTAIYLDRKVITKNKRRCFEFIKKYKKFIKKY